MKQYTTYDPEAMAIDAVLKLDSVIREISGAEAKCESLARRCTELPQFIAQTGLSMTILFYLSKSDSEIVRQLLNILTSGSDKNSDKIAEEIKQGIKEECEREGKGYSLSLALITYALNKIAEHTLSIDTCRFGSVDSSASLIRNIARCLRDIRTNRVEMRIEMLLRPYLDTVKRLTEALYKGERGRST